MHFTLPIDSSESIIWKKIMDNLEPSKRKLVSPSTSSFYLTDDGLECSLRKLNGSLIYRCYSESDRMGNRRWTCN